MNIQIFGKNKCFDTKKAQRYFKERNIKTVSQCQTVCDGDEYSLQYTGNSS